MTDFLVPGLSRKEIRRRAHAIRFKLDSGKAYFDVVLFLDVVLDKLLDGFELAIVSDSDLKGAHALADPAHNLITVTQSTYDGARSRNGRDRMTLIHEFAHLWLHKGIDLRFARSSEAIKAFESAEWQAKAFAGEFMIPFNRIQPNMSANEIANVFGVSVEAARYQLAQFKKEGLI